MEGSVEDAVVEAEEGVALTPSYDSLFQAT